MTQLTIKEQKQHAKENFIKSLKYTLTKIENLYIKEYPNGKPLLYPLTQNILELYKTIEKTIKTLNEELEKERQQ